MLFATHPVHTEAVAGVVGRADVLCGLFYILSLMSYMRYCSLRSEARSQRFIWLGAVLILTICSTLSKEIGITVLGVCVLYDLFCHISITLHDLKQWRTDKVDFQSFLLII